MPPRTKTTTRLAGLAGSDSEPDFDSFEPMHAAVARGSKSSVAAKPARGRPPAANRVTKPAPKSTRRTSDRFASAAPSPIRKALADKSNMNATRAGNGGKGSMDVDDNLENEGRLASQETKRATAGRGRPRTTKTQEATPVSAVKIDATKPRRGRRPAKRNIEPITEIPETQDIEAMVVDAQSDDENALPDEPRSMSDPVLRDWASDVDLDDVSIRRKLGELMGRYENLEMRHRDLREIGIKEAERNYERLRKQMDENAAGANKLISQLKDEVATQRTLAQRGDQLREQLEYSDDRAISLEKQVTELTTSLDKARAEIKTLSTKLAASRAAEATIKAPGSALKTGAGSGRMAPSEAVQAAQAKEDLYGDLTGLIVRGLKRGKQEDVFDCIQTGRNGTLHFKLALDRSEAADCYEDVQFTYRPQLDPNRDGDLMEMLPDYLVEEITFPRPQASKFYNRVIKSLTERLD